MGFIFIVCLVVDIVVIRLMNDIENFIRFFENYYLVRNIINIGMV